MSKLQEKSFLMVKHSVPDTPRDPSGEHKYQNKTESKRERQHFSHLVRTLNMERWNILTKIIKITQ